MKFDYPVYSSDVHIIEPPDLWTKRADAKWRDLTPRIVSLDDTDIWVIDKEARMAVVGIQDQAGYRFDDPTKITKKGRMDDLARGDAGWTPDLYCQGLEIDGVAGGVVYPSNLTQAFRCVAGELLQITAQVYNDYLITEFCGAEPKKLKAVAVIPVDDPAWAVKEMYRVAKLGAAALMPPVFPAFPKTYDMPEYEPVWAAAADIGLPVVFHLGTNQRGAHKEPPLDLIVHATKDIHIQRSLGVMVLSGLFVKYPQLQVVAAEFGASWAPGLMANLDRMYKKHPEELPMQFPAGELPSDHFRRNISLSFQDDEPAMAMREMLGIDKLQWGNDYPHAESTFPRSLEYLDRHLGHLPPDEARAIACDNSARMYGFDIDSAVVRASEGGAVATL